MIAGLAGSERPRPSTREVAHMSASRIARIAYRWMAWAFVAGVVLQFFFAGLALFAGQGFALHRDWGYTFGWITILLIVAALVGRMPRRAVGGAALLLVLFFLQSVFVGLRDSLPPIAALHPVNAIAIFWVGVTVARAAGAWQDAGAEQPAGAIA